MNQPIGIFDSGIGGLTVANSISRLMPEENLVYFGDTYYMPYGTKSPDVIQSRALKITDFLIKSHNCKAIIIACNSASATAYEILRDNLKGKIPIINVIDPIIEYLSDKQFKKIGLIATQATIDSGVYQEKIKRRIPNTSLEAKATPLLASIIEENFINHAVSMSVLDTYLIDKRFDAIDAMILGCTHYPLIAQEIQTYFSKQTEIIHSGEVTAEKLKSILTKENLLQTKPKLEDRFIVSMLTNSFEASTKFFYGKKISLEEKRF
ncbi:MAG: glutamate racemase [Chitinophagales bacterium]|jgi:glutamate racemase|nr:glutamate racemase [Chitinophagales bacterium]